MKHLYITYTTEKLYHFNCQKCKGWWSIADWKKPYSRNPNYLVCPYCEQKSEVKFLKKGVI